MILLDRLFFTLLIRVRVRIIVRLVFTVPIASTLSKDGVTIGVFDSVPGFEPRGVQSINTYTMSLLSIV